MQESNIKIENIIKSYGKNIQSLIRSFSPKKDSQDLEQEVYIKIWKNLSSYQDEGKIWSWLKRITVNTCKDHLRSKYYNQEIKTDYDDSNFLVLKDKKISPEKKMIMNERHKIIINAVESLKPKFKEVIILYDLKELSYEEISKKLKCPVGTVKSRLFNARKQLQVDLRELIN